MPEQRPKEVMSDATVPEAVRRAALDWLLAGEAARGGAAFRDWLAADAAHRRAFAEAERLWHDPSFLAALHRHKPMRRRRGITRPALALAASFLILAFIGLGALRLTGLPLQFGSDFATRIGSEQTETLPDGSNLVLDTESAADFSADSSERRLTLDDGRMFVAVHHEARPFRVHVGAITIQDIGTAFSVERRDGRVTVAVRQGEVVIRAPSGEESVRAGQAAVIAGGDLQAAQLIDPGIAFAWLDHRLFFQDAPLGDVVAELRRYQRGWIVLAKPSLAQIKVSGGYDLRAPAAAIQDLAHLSGAVVSQVSDRLLILH